MPKYLRSTLIGVLAAVTSSVFAGTFSLVSADTSLLVSSGTGVSYGASASTLSLTMFKNLSCYGFPWHTDSQSASGVLQGQMKWIVHWSPSYAGEGVPDHALVTFTITGHHYVHAAAPGHPMPPQQITKSATATCADFLTILQASAPSLGTEGWDGSETDSTLGTMFGGTGSFTLVSPGVYESTILYSPNCMYSASASTNYAEAGAYVDVYNLMTITKIGTQTM